LNFRLILFTLTTSGFLFSCTYQKAIEPKTDCPLKDSISFSADVLPVFQENCTSSECHSSVNPGGNLILEPGQAYKQLMEKKSGYIDTLNPKASVLYIQMNSRSQPMPPTGKLDNCTIQLILKWIEQKAPNN